MSRLYEVTRGTTLHSLIPQDAWLCNEYNLGANFKGYTVICVWVFAVNIELFEGHTQDSFLKYPTKIAT